MVRTAVCVSWLTFISGTSYTLFTICICQISQLAELSLSFHSDSIKDERSHRDVTHWFLSSHFEAAILVHLMKERQV